MTNQSGRSTEHAAIARQEAGGEVWGQMVRVLTRRARAWNLCGGGGTPKNILCFPQHLLRDPSPQLGNCVSQVRRAGAGAAGPQRDVSQTREGFGAWAQGLLPE